MDLPRREVEDNWRNGEVLPPAASSSNHGLQAYDEDDELAWLQENIELQEALELREAIEIQEAIELQDAIEASLACAQPTATSNPGASDSKSEERPTNGFLALSPELRNRIYDFVYTSNDEYQVQHRSEWSTSHRVVHGTSVAVSRAPGASIPRRVFSAPLRGATSLSLSCRQIHTETSAFLASLRPLTLHHFHILNQDDREVFKSTIPRILAPPNPATHLKITLVLTGRHYSALAFLQTMICGYSYPYYDPQPLPQFASLKRLDVQLLNPHGPDIESRHQLLREAHSYASHSNDSFYRLETSVAHLKLNGATDEMRTVPGTRSPDTMKRTWTLRYEAE
jgi:hypothetical protein